METLQARLTDHADPASDFDNLKLILIHFPLKIPIATPLEFMLQFACEMQKKKTAEGAGLWLFTAARIN